MQDYDVVVVGAGPSGSVCAHDCARSGLDTLVLERETLPRDKPCGGAVASEVIERYPELRPVVSRRTTWTRTYLNYEVILEYRNERSMFLRRELDGTLARRAERAGADLVDGTKATSIEVDGRGVDIGCEGGATYRAKMVVDATGAKGNFFREHKAQARERLDYNIVSMVAEVPCANDVMEQRLGNDRPMDRSFYEAYLMTGFIGYGWVFPKDGRVNIGLGTVTTHSHNLNDKFLAFVRQTGFDDLDLSKATAGMIPTVLLPRLWLPRVLFVGDAGGFVDALTGGGIGYGMCSGESAAIIAKEAVEADDFSGRVLEGYEHLCKELRKELGFRTTALYYLAGAVKRGLDRPLAVRLLLRTMLPRFSEETPSVKTYVRSHSTPS